MKKFGVATALIVGLLFAAGIVSSLAEAATGPPTNLKKVGDHWTPWDPPEAGPDAYIIQKGDTLWDLSGRWFDDPFLWPQIWDENRYILDSHWIYPGDPLVVPGRPTVVPEGDLPPIAEGATDPLLDDRLTTKTPTPRPTLPMPEPLLAVADSTDLYCSGYIAEGEHTPETWIAGRDIERVILGQGDVIFLNHGRSSGVRAGDEFGIVRWTRKVVHPESNELLGKFVRRMGRARVLLSYEDTATAVITMSCEDIGEGDELVPWQDIPVPMMTGLPPFERLDGNPSGGSVGSVVTTKDNVWVFGSGHVIYTDLGQASGVTPGDVLTVFRERGEGLPRRNLGQAVILTVENRTSTAKMMNSTSESTVGDKVEVLR